jgi:hypothetical protein
MEGASGNCSGGIGSSLEVMTQVELKALKKRLFEDSSVKNIKFFPGTNSDASPEDFAREINKFFAEAENGAESFNLEEDVDGECT